MGGNQNMQNLGKIEGELWPRFLWLPACMAKVQDSSTVHIALKTFI